MGDPQAISVATFYALVGTVFFTLAGALIAGLAGLTALDGNVLDALIYLGLGAGFMALGRLVSRGIDG